MGFSSGGRIDQQTGDLNAAASQSGVIFASQTQRGIRPQDVPRRAGVLRTIQAAAEQENSVYSFFAGGFNNFEPEEDYDPFQDPSVIDENMTPFKESFVESRSRAESSFIRTRIERELENRRILEQGGAGSMATVIGSAILDPIYFIPMLLPGGAFVRGAGIAKTVARISAVSGASEAVAEGAKHVSQETRTLGQSAINVGAATILTGVMGTGFAAVSKVRKIKMESRLRDYLGDDKAAEDMISAGYLEQLGLNPGVRTMNSPSQGTRTTIQGLAEISSPLIKNVDGRATGFGIGSVETAIKAYGGPLYHSLKSLDDNYLKYRGVRSEAVLGKVVDRSKMVTDDLVDFVKRGDRGFLSRRDFNIEVGKAVRRGGAHEIPEVATTAKDFKTRIFEPIKKAAQEQKLLDEAIPDDFALNYLTRLYNNRKIVRQRGQWNEILFRHLDGERSALKVKAAKQRAELESQIAAAPTKGVKVAEKKLADLEKQANASDDDLKNIIDDITENILGSPVSRTAYDQISLRGPFKKRALLIDDKLIEDFLESDIDVISRFYVNTMAPDIELTKRMGSIDLTDQIKGIKTDYSKLRDNVIDKVKDPKKQEKRLAGLDRQFKQDITDIQAVTDRLRGVRSLPADPDSFFLRVSQTARTLNFVSKLGGMTLSAFPDVAGTIMVNGLKPVTRSLKALVVNLDAVKFTKQQNLEWSVGADMILNGRNVSLSEMGDIYSRGTAFERGLAGVGDRFGKISLMTQWNATWRQWAGVVTSTRILDVSAKVAKGTATKAEITRLSASRISTPMAKRIARQLEKHGESEEGFHTARADKWDDREAYEAFKNAVIQDVDRQVIVPGVADKPLWMDANEFGKHLGQFKSFAFAAHNKILLANIQYRDRAALNGILIAVGMGAITYATKENLAGRKVSDDPKKILIEAIDRSGLMGVAFDVNNIVEKMTRGEVGLSKLTGEGPMSRYASRNAMGALLGPTAGTFQDLSTVTGAVATGDISQGDVRSMRRVLPLQNLFYIRQLLDSMEEKIAGEIVTE